MIFALALAVMATPPCTSHQGQLTRAQARARVDSVRALLVREHEAYRAWQAGWVTTMAVAVVGQGAWANASAERGRRASLLAGTLKATSGLVAVITMPEPELPGDWVGDVCLQLRAAEAALAELAGAQSAARAVWRHVGSVVLNVAATLFAGLVYDEWLLGTTSGVLGMAVGQAILRTRPDGAAAREDSSLGVSVGPGTASLVYRF